MNDAFKAVYCYICSEVVGYAAGAPGAHVCIRCKESPEYNTRRYQHRLDDLRSDVEYVKWEIGDLRMRMAKKQDKK